MNPRKLVLTIGILLILTMVAVGYQLSFAYIQTPSATIESGSMVQPASYTIFRDSSGNIYARNGTTGEITYSGSNFTVVLQNVIDDSTVGITIFLTAGTYDITDTITLRNFVSFRGVHNPQTNDLTLTEESTILNLADDNDMFEAIGTNRVTDRRYGVSFENIMFDGNSKVYRIIDAKYLDNVYFEDVTFYKAIPAVYAQECWDWKFYNVNFIFSGDSSNPAVTVENTDDDNTNHFYFTNCRWEDLTGIGFYSDSSNADGANNRFKFVACKFEGHDNNNQTAIAGFFRNSLITGCSFSTLEVTGNFAINLNGTNQYNVITNNEFISNSGDIRLGVGVATNNIISANIFRNALDTYHISLNGYNNTLVNNQVIGTKTFVNLAGGLGNTIFNNFGYMNFTVATRPSATRAGIGSIIFVADSNQYEASNGTDWIPLT